MSLNYLAFFLISFVPLIVGYIWYNPQSSIHKRFGAEAVELSKLSYFKIFLLFIMSFTLVYGYINLVVHQMGFYELFFTDIMRGSDEAKAIVEDFLAQYGDKHRHFGHGIFHGIINAFVFALPFVAFHTVIGERSKRYLLYHFTYWLITTTLVCGLISEFV